MEQEPILVRESLAETLWRLEEVRLKFRPKSAGKVDEALDFVLSRQGLKGSYRNLFAATDQDLPGVKLPTGERLESASLRHVLGEEALRTAVLWNRGSTSAVKKALEGYGELLERGEPCARKSGFFCCYKCTLAFLRTLVAVKPNDWTETLERGIQRMKSERISNGRWHGFPFFYTLLTLSEIDSPSAKTELRNARITAGKILKRYEGNDRTSRFRRLGLEAAMSA